MHKRSHNICLKCLSEVINSSVTDPVVGKMEMTDGLDGVRQK